MIDRNPAIARAECSLHELSVGDAFGETFFVNPAVVEGLIDQRALAPSPWHFTDDTMMGMSIVVILRRYGFIHQDDLAESFARCYETDRGYGPAMHGLLAQLRLGAGWEDETRTLFSGQGSFGNGAAMRAGPIGAYFADSIDDTVINASRSAVVTHAHDEGVAGAIAVSVAAAYAWRLGVENKRPTRAEFVDLVLVHVPDSEVRSKLRLARDISPHTDVAGAVGMLGNGTKVSAQDTVPFALWCAGEMLDDYENALWLTVSGLGDRDTTCAIVGSIVVMYCGQGSIPPLWLESRESLPS